MIFTSKNILIFYSFLLLSTYTHADGPLQMKGFHHDLSLEKACLMMSTFKSERGDFLFKREQQKCGFGRNGFITYPCITGDKNTGMIDSIILSPDVVNRLFEAEKLNANTFAKSFLHTYNWIDTFRTRGIYRQESKKYGWSLIINKRKWIKIHFFSKTNTVKKTSQFH